MDAAATAPPPSVGDSPEKRTRLVAKLNELELQSKAPARPLSETGILDGQMMARLPERIGGSCALALRVR